MNRLGKSQMQIAQNANASSFQLVEEEEEEIVVQDNLIPPSSTADDGRQLEAAAGQFNSTAAESQTIDVGAPSDDELDLIAKVKKGM